MNPTQISLDRVTVRLKFCSLLILLGGIFQISMGTIGSFVLGLVTIFISLFGFYSSYNQNRETSACWWTTFVVVFLFYFFAAIAVIVLIFTQPDRVCDGIRNGCPIHREDEMFTAIFFGSIFLIGSCSFCLFTSYQYAQFFKPLTQENQFQRTSNQYYPDSDSYSQEDVFDNESAYWYQS